MDQLSTSSGHTSETTTDREQSKLPPETQGNNEMTLMKLRRLTRIVMCKSERHRFETRTLQRSNIIEYLEENLMHTSEQIRTLSLEMLCCTIPRLGNKTDCLLRPLLPKVFQCLKKNGSKELKTRALHFLRGYFHHSQRLSGFIDNFIKLGIQSSDSEIQISCCLGLNIIFDQDLGNGLYPQLVTPVANILMQKKNLDLTRAAYRALKCIHNIVKDTRFYDFMNMTHPDATEMYKNMYNFEDMDSFLTMNDNNCSAVILEYHIKRHYLSLNKDFGILDPTLLFQIQKTRSCERAIAVYNFFTALKHTPWIAEDLDVHILDLLKVIKSFVSDSNRLVQSYGFYVLKEIINKVGFRLSPHIQCVVEILQKGLTSANTKVRKNVHRVIHKLMRSIHPMTVVWNLLNTDDTSVREAVIMLIQNILSHFSYHEMDMIALCNYLGLFLEDSNISLANCSRDCIILLLNTMRDCPAYGIKTEAVKSLLKNYSLSTQTLKDIGIIGNMEEDAYQKGFESYSEEDISDHDASSIQNSSTVIDTSLSTRSLSTAGESNARHGCACSGFHLGKSFKNFGKDSSCYHLKGHRLYSVEPSDISTAMSHRSISSTVEESDTRCDTICRNSGIFQPRDIFYDQASCSRMHEDYKSSKKESPEEENTTVNLDSDSMRNNQATVIWGENFIDSLNKMEENISGESSVTSSVKERILSSDSRASQFSAYAKHEPGASIQPWPSFNIDNNPKYSHDTKGTEDSNIQKNLAPENADSDDIKKQHVTRFHVDPETNDFGSDSEKQAGGDADSIQENRIATSAQECDTELDTEVELTTDAQGGIQVDVLNNSVYNFNIMTIDHAENDKDSDYTDDFDPLDDSSEIDKANTINQSRETVLETDEDCSQYKTKKFRKSMIPKFKGLKLNPHTNISKKPECAGDLPQCDTLPQKPVQSNAYEQDENDVDSSKGSSVGSRVFQETPVIEESPLEKDTQDVLPHSPNKETIDTQENDFVEELGDRCASDTERSEFLCTDTFQENDGPTTEASLLYSKDFDETPFLPKNRLLPRTPVTTKPEHTTHVQPKPSRNCRKNPVSIKRKTAVKKNRELKNVETSRNTPSEEREKSLKERTDETSIPNSSLAKSSRIGKYNSPPSWEGCQWRRDLEYASKALPCTWVDKFEKVVKAMKPFSSLEEAENEMKKATEDLHGSSWIKKEEAMLTLIQLTKHHPEVVLENTTKITFLLCNEVKNFRQSVAGKAILTIGHLYEIMGKHFENKLRLVIAALLAKSGNRTLAAYFRLIIKTLFKIMNSCPQKSAMAFIYEGYKHTNKAARETAAQFLAILTENLGPENSLTPALSSHMLKCAASFTFDSSALTRYCGKRMLNVFMNHPGFEKIKDHHLDIDTSHNLSKVLEQITAKGVGEDVLPISLID